MNTPKVAAALNTISLAFGELAEALLENGTGRLSDREAMSAALAPPVASGAVQAAMPEFPPNDYEDVPLPADSPGLGRCPTHGTAWTVKAAGVSKAGKPYNSFYKCDGKDQDGAFCQKKPTKAWADAHPIA